MFCPKGYLVGNWVKKQKLLSKKKLLLVARIKKYYTLNVIKEDEDQT